MKNRFTIIIAKEEIAYVAYCRELGIASQGRTVRDAKKNIREAIELYLEEAKHSKVSQKNMPIITTITVSR